MILKNVYFSWRYLKQNPMFTVINVAGLVIGITSALFIFIYINYEISYDKFNRDYEDIYRVIGVDSELGDGSSRVGITMPVLGAAMEENIPGVLNTVRISDETRGGFAFVTVGDKKFDVSHVAFSDDAFFDVFNFPLLQQQGEVLLSRPHTAVISASFAKRIFGDAAPLGKLLNYEGQDVEVVGIMADSPADSHIQLDVLLDFGTQYPDPVTLRGFLNSWDYIGMVTYAKLEPDADVQDVITRMQQLVTERRASKNFSATLVPLTDAHLDSSDVVFDDFNYNKGDKQKLVMLGSVAAFLLLIAAFNFMNLSTARSSSRAKEVGIHKAAGATRRQLIQQYMQESLLLVFTAAVLGVLLLGNLAPLVSLPLAQGYVSYFLTHANVMMGAFSALVLLGVFSGSYPALVLSSFSPVAVLKGKFTNSGQGLRLRRTLVIVQFALSITIIIGMLVVYRQLEFMKSVDPGFDHDGIVNLALEDETLANNYDALRNRLLQIPQVLSVAGSSSKPGRSFSSSSNFRPADSDANTDAGVTAWRLRVDEHYLDTLQMTLVAGRNYSRATPSDEADSIILNESAARALGWENNAIGKSIITGPAQRTVIGVVRDFHFTDMHKKIEPVMMLYQGTGSRLLSIRIDKNAPREALEGIEAAWKDVNPDYPFSYTWFTDDYNQLFSDDEEFSSMLVQFTFIAIIISCLGLFGLAAFNAEQKTKEIGIRKVLGAGNGSLLKMLLQEYAVLLVVANLLAWGAAWFVTQQWLAGFAYRIELSASSFILATVGTSILAALTVGREILKVVKDRPVNALRYE
ncbi:MAG: ABC transporter permease [Pseudomonadota bacterium]